jgi:predicted methyltransferase MtxX (methanogen marker protein 4)
MPAHYQDIGEIDQKAEKLEIHFIHIMRSVEHIIAVTDFILYGNVITGQFIFVFIPLLHTPYQYRELYR